MKNGHEIIDVTRYQEIELQQREICRLQGVNYVSSDAGSMIAFAMQTRGLMPINGLRHPKKAATNGWFIWCGEELSNDDDFFSPNHTIHLLETCPEALEYLGLPPGYRFLTAGEYVDIWYDPALLEV